MTNLPGNPREVFEPIVEAEAFSPAEPTYQAISERSLRQPQVLEVTFSPAEPTHPAIPERL